MPLYTVVASPPKFGPDWRPAATPPANAAGTLQALVDAAAPGATVLVPPGTYRETVTISQAITLDGQKAAWVVGSTVSGGVETAARAVWIAQNADNIVIKNFAFKYTNQVLYGNSMGGYGNSNFTVQNCWLDGTGGAGGLIGLGAGSGFNIIHCDLGFSGDEAYAMSSPTTALIQYCRIHDNNTTNHNTQDEAGAGKIVTATATGTGIIIDSNEVFASGGFGPWFDINCSNVTISNNRIHGETTSGTAGLMFELCTNVNIFGNVMWDCQGSANSIQVSSSGHANVHDNFICRAPSIGAILETRSGQMSDVGTYINMHDNFAVAPTDSACTTWNNATSPVVSFGPTTTNNADTNNTILTGAAATAAMIAHGVPTS